MGSKKSLDCSHAIYCVRNIVNHYVSHGSTVNLCALDITKAFDRLNHDRLFINLMRRFILATLLNVLEKWLGICYTYVSWNSAYSHMFKLTSGVRQGGVLSLYLYAAYIDDLINHVHNKQIWCMYRLIPLTRAL